MFQTLWTWLLLWQTLLSSQADIKEKHDDYTKRSDNFGFDAYHHVFLLVIDSEICLFCRQLKKFFFRNMPYLKLYTLLICEF